VKNGLRVVLSSDDPGIFSSSLSEEENFARRHLGISDEEISRMGKTASSVRSGILSGRPILPLES
jgi:adenosine deaminase